MRLSERADDPLDVARCEFDKSWSHKYPIFQRSTWFAKYIHDLDLMSIH
jgi:hypothetical protein